MSASTCQTDVATAGRAARTIENPAFITVVSGDDTARTGDRPAAGGPFASLPFAGVPFAVKDNIDVAGLPTTLGHPGRMDPVATSAVAVQRLVDAGAVPIGKTNMDQFATGLVGTRSPFGACHCVDSVEHVSGGSSSGSAVAVAAGIVPFALATDTAGSGRVPAAFNGIVGVKPTRGLVSTRGVFPACPSLDCVSILSTTVETGRAVLDVVQGHDPLDPGSRIMPTFLPDGIARTMHVVGVPSGPLDLDDLHRDAWQRALRHVGTVARLRPVDVSPLLEAAQLLYGGPFVAERLAAFGHLLEPDSADLDPVVRRIVLGASELRAADLFTAMHRLRELTRLTAELFAGVDAILLPVTPGHPRIAEVRADPIGVNSRLGTFTNMVNLLDLCAVALPFEPRADGLPFGAQLLAPAFADDPLLNLASRVLGEADEPAAPIGPGRSLLAVCGAHLSGQPLNVVLRAAGARLHSRALTSGGYRMVRVDGAVPRPGLVDDVNAAGAGFEIELWDVPLELLHRLEVDIEAPLGIGPVRLMDGSCVPGFLADPGALAGAVDISRFAGWRDYLDTMSSSPAARV